MNKLSDCLSCKNLNNLFGDKQKNILSNHAVPEYDYEYERNGNVNIYLLQLILKVIEILQLQIKTQKDFSEYVKHFS
ncbi:MAG: hypothetical protein LBB45_03535 [Methanobrevibacter sp.]|jgi:hypothetical protein|nr:hypothetical protein [Candidatus Methanovirga basalitermitum]